ncbi:MAG: hypothetical protein SGJ10_10180 [Bacteroidota bacterium]|nr:hypothetical protein [Bacteroidota bacterium]
MKSERSTEMTKIIEGMDLVSYKLIAFKKIMNSDLVVMEGDKIVHIEPEDLDAYVAGNKKEKD